MGTNAGAVSVLSLAFLCFTLFGVREDIYRKMFRIDKEMYDKIVQDLSVRGDFGATERG